MSTVPPSPNPIRAAIAPLLSVRNGAQAITFYEKAFAAKVVFRIDSDDGKVVAHLSVDGADFWVADESPENANFSPETLNGGTVRMILTVADPDAVFALAVAAGGRGNLAGQQSIRLASWSRRRSLRAPLGNRASAGKGKLRRHIPRSPPTPRKPEFIGNLSFALHQTP